MMHLKKSAVIFFLFCFYVLSGSIDTEATSISITAVFKTVALELNQPLAEVRVLILLFILWLVKTISSHIAFLTFVKRAELEVRRKMVVSQ